MYRSQSRRLLLLLIELQGGHPPQNLVPLSSFGCHLASRKSTIILDHHQKSHYQSYLQHRSTAEMGYR